MKKTKAKRLTLADNLALIISEWKTLMGYFAKLQIALSGLEKEIRSEEENDSIASWMDIINKKHKKRRKRP